LPITKNVYPSFRIVSKIETALRIFELDLMDAVGYGLQLEYDFHNDKAIQPLTNYHFNVEQGRLKRRMVIFRVRLYRHYT